MADKLPEDAAHVVVQSQQQYVSGNNPNEIRVPLSRLPEDERDDVETEDETRTGSERVVYRAGDEIPLELARSGTYSSFSDMLAVFDEDGERLDVDRDDYGNTGLQKWRNR